jgi:hypothetical protein
MPLLVGNTLPPEPLLQVVFDFTNCPTFHRAETDVVIVQWKGLQLEEGAIY